MDPAPCRCQLAWRKIVGSDIPKFAVLILAINEFFAAVFEATGNRDRTGTKIQYCAASGNMPGERAGANVFPYLRTQGIIELAVDVASKPFVNKRIEELADMTRQLPGQRQSQAVFPGLVIDGFCSITLPVLEVSVDYPVMRQLESRADHLPDRTGNRGGFPSAHLW